MRGSRKTAKITTNALDQIVYRTLTTGGSIIVWLVSSFTSLDSTVSLHTNF